MLFLYIDHYLPLYIPISKFPCWRAGASQPSRSLERNFLYIIIIFIVVRTSCKCACAVLYALPSALARGNYSGLYSRDMRTYVVN